MIDTLTSGSGAPAAAGVDQQRAQLEAVVGKIRDLDQQIQQVFGEMPTLQPIAQQMRQLIKRAVQEAIKAVPAQTGSAQALPMAGQ